MKTLTVTIFALLLLSGNTAAAVDWHVYVSTDPTDGRLERRLAISGETTVH